MHLVPLRSGRWADHDLRPEDDMKSEATRADVPIPRRDGDWENHDSPRCATEGSYRSWLASNLRESYEDSAIATRNSDLESVHPGEMLCIPVRPVFAFPIAVLGEHGERSVSVEYHGHLESVCGSFQ